MMNKPKKSRFWLILSLCMLVYAIVFICVAYQGFSWFWDFIEAYERSRPQTTIDAYMDQLDTEQVQNGSAELIASIDHNIQSEEDCRLAIADALSGGISYARKLNECNDTTMVYMLLSGGKTIGRVTLSARAADAFGFTPWVVSDESFDMSFLIGQGASITVPEEYPVFANGTQLSSDYITESDIPYSLLEDYYEEYELPSMVTYTVAPILGTVELEVTDPNLNPVTEKAWADQEAFLSNCSDVQKKAVTDFTGEFILAYVNYTTNSGGLSRYDNYAKLSKYLVEGSSLQKRMKEALDGLMWVTSRQAEILSVSVDRCIHTLDGYYLCNITYSARSITYGGVKVDETFQIQLILTETAQGLRAETMHSN